MPKISPLSLEVLTNIFRTSPKDPMRIINRDPSQMTWTWWEMFCYGMLDLAKRTGLDGTS